jgi:hypothetical protein
MNPDYEKLSKYEVPELDALLTKLMLYLQSVTDSEQLLFAQGTLIATLF